MTDTKVSAAESIAAVLARIGAVGKDSRNAQQGFNYRGVDAVVNAVHPVLSEVGGFILPRMVSQEVEHATTAKGAAMTVVRLVTDYAWYGTDGGEPVVGRVSSEAFDTADKATAKAWSVAYRTFLLQTLNLPTDDPDPDDSYIERGKIPERHWVEEANKLPTADAVLALWQEAKAGGAAKSGLDAIAAIGKKLRDAEAKAEAPVAASWDPIEVKP